MLSGVLSHLPRAGKAFGKRYRLTVAEDVQAGEQVGTAGATAPRRGTGTPSGVAVAEMEVAVAAAGMKPEEKQKRL